MRASKSVSAPLTKGRKLEPHEDLCHPRPTAVSADDQDMDLGKCQSMHQWLRNGLCCTFMGISDLGHYVLEIGGQCTPMLHYMSSESSLERQNPTLKQVAVG